MTKLGKSVVFAGFFVLVGLPSAPVAEIVPTVGGSAMAEGILCRWLGFFCGPGDTDPYMVPLDLPCDDPWEWMDPACGGPTAPPRDPDCSMLERQSVPRARNPMVSTSTFESIDRARAWGSVYRSKCPYGGAPGRDVPITMSDLVLRNHAMTMLGMGRTP